MTCIVGIVIDGEVTIGGDSAGASGWDIVDVVGKKVFRVGNMIMGYTTSFRMGQILEHKLEVPPYKTSMDVTKYMVVDFIDAVRKTFKENGFSSLNNNVERGGTFLVGFQGRLFTIYDDFQVSENRTGMAAVGCGGAYALGALYMSEKNNARHKLIEALKISEILSNGVRGPFFFETLEKPAERKRK